MPSHSIRFLLLALICLLGWMQPAGASEPAKAAPLRILVYSDSNTWGWRPSLDDSPLPRYADGERWAGVLQDSLGAGYQVTVNGLIARTLSADLPPGVGPLNGPEHNGLKRLDSALMEAGPVHLLIVMLGSNDMMDVLHRSPKQIAAGLGQLARKAKAGTEPYAAPEAPRLLLIVPPAFGDPSRGPFKRLFGPAAVAKSAQLAQAMRQEALRLKLPLMDAGQPVSLKDSADGIHLTAQAHVELGRAVAAEVRKRLAPAKE